MLESLTLSYYLTTFYSFLKLFILTCSVLVVTASNPIYSILFLILIFAGTSIIFVLLNADFLALILIIVYLGAICVSFLSIIMMLNIKILEIKREINYIPFIFIILSLIFFIGISEIEIPSFIFSGNENNITTYLNINLEKNFQFILLLIDTEHFLNKLTNISFSKVNNDLLHSNIINQNSWTIDSFKSLGLIIYTFFSLQFIVSGFVLLIAMVGAIFLTLENQFVITKKQFLYSQISRSKAIFTLFNL